MNEMTPVEWATRPLKKYATFSGRASRAEYWWFYLATAIVQIPLEILAWTLEIEWPSAVYSLALLIPFISVTVRRLHDTDRSGWWLAAFVLLIAVFAAFAVNFELSGSEPPTLSMMAALLIAVVGGITLFIFTVLPGTEGPNRYGPDPYGPDGLEEVFA